VRRLHGQRRMDGLGVHDGWSCKIGVCTAVSTKGSAIGQHCRQAHGLQVKTGGVVSGVRLQTVFGEKARYFVVTVVEVVSRAGRRGVRVAQAAAWPGAPRHGPDVGHVSSVRRWLRWGSRRATSYPGRPRRRRRWLLSATASIGCCRGGSAAAGQRGGVAAAPRRPPAVEQLPISRQVTGAAAAAAERR